MAGNAAKRKMRNLKLEKDPEYCKKKEMYSARDEVNWTLVQAEESWILISPLPFVGFLALYAPLLTEFEGVGVSLLPAPLLWLGFNVWTVLAQLQHSSGTTLTLTNYKP